MNIKKILSSKQISPSKIVLQITAEEALSSIKEMLAEFSLKIDFNKLSKEELEKLLFDYANAVDMYHPEDYHQERAAILKNETVLKKYGLTAEDVKRLDFV